MYVLQECGVVLLTLQHEGLNNTDNFSQNNYLLLQKQYLPS